MYSVFCKMIPLLLITNLILLTSVAKKKSRICYLKLHCTKDRSGSCCYEWPVSNFTYLVNSNIALHVSPGEYTLINDMKITAVSNVAIIGEDTKFICNKNKFLMSISKSSSVHIANIQFINCGHMIEHSTGSAMSAAVYLFNASSVNMTNVTLQNNCGYGIIGIDIVGVSVFKNVNICQTFRKSSICHYHKSGGIVWSYNKSITKCAANFSLSNLNILGIINDGNDSFTDSPIVHLVLHHQKCVIDISHLNIVNVASANASLVFISVLSKSKINLSYNRYKNNIISSVLNVINSSDLTVQSNSFYNNTAHEYLVSFPNTISLFRGLSIFEYNKANVVLRFNKYIILSEKAVVSFSHNRPSPLKQTFHRFIIERWDEATKECPFQVRSRRSLMYTSIKFCDNMGYFREVYVDSFLQNCIWYSASMNGEHLPDLETLYNYIIRTCENETRIIKFGQENDICQCDSRNNCLIYEPKSIYPGQSVAVNLQYSRSSYNILVNTENENPFKDIAPTCEISPKCDTVYNYKCTKLSYTVEFNATSGSKCLILLSTAKQLIYVLNVTTINCPIGFSLNSGGVCDCDPNLQNKIDGIVCNVSKKAFKLPPNWWISATSHHDIIYSTYCKNGYCIQSPGFISLHSPDDQCLGKRRGINCGRCVNGLSTVLGSNTCRKCSNNGLFFIILFAFAGILLVLSLFVLNLTVANGDIYGFIFFVNVLGVNSSKSFATSFVIVALANLDWGIESCFYDGMTAYVATWLQFIFPVYLLLIVSGLIIASRYSTKIEKLTRAKVIPVIATLHLPLFIFCAIILLFVIIPVNVLLLFTKSFYRFKFVSKYLKPFLDAYQAPFKDESRFLLGLELLLRAIVYMVYHFFGRQAAAIYITIILLYTAFICWLKPFKSLLKLFLYLLYMIYLGLLTILFLHFSVINMKPDETFKVIFRIVVLLGFVEFLTIVASHVWKYVLYHFEYFKKHSQNLKLNQLTFASRKNLSQVSTQSQESSRNSGNYHEYRDELRLLDSS